MKPLNTILASFDKDVMTKQEARALIIKLYPLKTIDLRLQQIEDYLEALENEIVSLEKNQESLYNELIEDIEKIIKNNR